MSLKELATSHAEFKQKHQKELAQHFAELAEKGQNPETLFISCSDSRVLPNLITNTKPGDLFIDRNVGNLIPPFMHNSECTAISASVEYAIHHLHVKNIIVCGHTHCGACAALYEENDSEDQDTEHLVRWLQFANSAKMEAVAMIGKQDKEQLLRATERFNVIEQLRHLLTYPVVQKAIEEDSLFIQGWYYHIENGDVEYFDPIEHRFKLLTELVAK
jgi:carbonic anhydrase